MVYFRYENSGFRRGAVEIVAFLGCYLNLADGNYTWSRNVSKQITNLRRGMSRKSQDLYFKTSQLSLLLSQGLKQVVTFATFKYKLYTVTEL
jgi:hypothetical protein